MINADSAQEAVDLSEILTDAQVAELMADDLLPEYDVDYSKAKPNRFADVRVARPTSAGIELRRAAAADWEDIWPIFRSVVAAGDTYVYAPEITEAEACSLWMSVSVSTFVALQNGSIVGSYLLKPNQPGLGSHVANAAFMVKPETAGRGIGRAMGLHALEEAKAAGYAAMQFNFVVSSNTRAVKLWQSLGFAIVGTVPKAFRHRHLGLTDAYVMHRLLD